MRKALGIARNWFAGGLSLALAVSLGAQELTAQIADQVVAIGKRTVSSPFFMARFDRRLHLLGTTYAVDPAVFYLLQYWAMAVDGQGHYWFPAISQFDDRGLLVRFDGNGVQIHPSIVMQHQPVMVSAAKSGMVVAQTVQPSTTGIGPPYGFAPDGTFLWTCPRLPQFFSPNQFAMTPSGGIWLGGNAFTPVLPEVPYLLQLDPADGSLVQGSKIDMFPGVDFNMQNFAAAPDGTLWAMCDSALVHLDGVQPMQYKGTLQTYTTPMHVDAAGDPLFRYGYVSSDPLETNTKIARYDAQSLTLAKLYSLKGQINGFALGPSGEDAYVAVVMLEPPYDFPMRLVRLNLVTGTSSSIDLAPLGVQWGIPDGDPTGFIWANVTDQQGDADADGATNRSETIAGSDPFDATSRPEGPKVYITFEDVTNALVLTFKDPDGLFDPAGGLDFSTLSVTASGFGEVLPNLVSAITTVDVAADGKSATVTFGGRPLAEGLKIELEVRVSDRTGATAWDWQVTPPGDL